MSIILALTGSIAFSLINNRQMIIRSNDLYSSGFLQGPSNDVCLFGIESEDLTTCLGNTGMEKQIRDLDIKMKKDTNM
jgi:hypothetical protein